MKLLIFIGVLISSFFALSQDQSIKGLISNSETRTLYRGYDNPLEIYTCEACDSVYVSSPDAEITMRNNLQFFVNPKVGMRNLMLSVKCINGSDTTKLWSERYVIKALPNPKIYLGGIDVNSDFNHVKELNLIAQNRFTARYDENVQITSVRFSIIEWSIKIGKTTFTNSNAKITDHFKAAFIRARKGTKVYFDYVVIIPPDGISRKIKLDQIYCKKAKRNTDYGIDPDQDRYLNPESGG
ncbi:MAG: hypothetical protein ACI8ZM_000257 [Crocinitomix sp.]|jgi:hypothetical protein